MTWLIAALGACIGVATGLLGAGGSILTVLLLVHAGGLDIGSAITTSLVVVAAMSLVAFVPHARAGAVVWRAALSFGFASMAGAALGGHLSTLLPSGVLRVIFLIAMMVAAVAMLWERPPPPSGETGTHEHPIAMMAGSGLLLGVLTGMVGLGGGFAVVPLLVVFARAPMRSAVGTSMLVIAMNTLAGLAGHLPHLSVHWGLAAYLSVAEILGGLLGVRFIERVTVKVLRRGFAGLMLAAAVFVLGDALLTEHRARRPGSNERTTQQKGQAMTDKQIAPTRAYRDYLSSSLVWGDFLAQGGFFPGDIVVADPFKAGTTWTQRILQQILDNGEERGQGLSDTSPWLDSSWGDHARMLAALREQRSRGQRRVIKSHLPADALPIAAEARYLFVGRNGKDLGISLHNYLKNFSPETMATITRVHAEWSRDPSPLSIPESMQEFFDLWLDTGGYGCCDLFDVVKSWWRLRDQPNVMLLHYRQLKEDLRGQVARIARFIDVEPASLRMDLIVEHSAFGYMRARAGEMAPFGGAHMGDPKAFFHKGPARDHRAELTPEQIERFDRKAGEKLGADAARWLETGEAQRADRAAA